MRREAEGYFTVEAAMVMPMVLYVIMMLIYLLFFQYNRCLLELEVGTLAVRGSMVRVKNNEDRAEWLRKQDVKRDEEKYIAWQCGETQWRLERGKLWVQQQGTLKIPFAEEVWSVNVNYENHVSDPVSVLRYYRKMGG